MQGCETNPGGQIAPAIHYADNLDRLHLALFRIGLVQDQIRRFVQHPRGAEDIGMAFTKTRVIDEQAGPTVGIS